MRKLSFTVFLTVALGLFTTSFAQASDLLFEGYYKVVKGGAHAGYYIMKHEYEPKKKQFISTTFLKIEGKDGITESIKAVASENKFAPVSFTYTAIGGGQTRTIDAKVANLKMTGTINANGKIEKVSRTIKKDTISSLFLIYAILSRPEGLKANSAPFNYEAVAEELADVTTGVVKIKDLEDVNGTKALRLENSFLGSDSVNFVTDKGEVLMTVAPTQKLSVELVAKPEQALGSFTPPTSLLKSLFGNMPEGTKNSMAQSGKAGK